MALTINQFHRSAQGYTEPLLTVAGDIPLHMVLIPSGKFTMGSPDLEPKRREAEGPQHEVTVPSFFLGRYPVTQAQWRAVAALPEIKQSLASAPAHFHGNNHPVEKVSWHDATEFCTRLAQHTGRPYRLPSEAEWEYACRAGTTTPFYFGNTLTDELANYDADASVVYANGPPGKCRQKTTPVNYFDYANRFGISDMHGNVCEWCADHGHKNYNSAPTNGSAWIKNGDSSERVIRGGAWLYRPAYCRSALRFNWLSEDSKYFIGFRVSCDAPKTQ
ncbi:MAG: formylglycine-generating enzyme family protein [Cyanobacteria bacterium P01_A01_bin.116]